MFGQIFSSPNTLIEARFFQYLMYLFIDTGEHNGYFFLLGHLTKACQVVDTGRIDERNFTHADDAHFGAVAQPRHDSSNLVAMPKK